MKTIIRSVWLLSLSFFSVSAAVAESAADAESFGCIRDMSAVRGFYVDNLKGDLDATLAVANAGTGTYPEGSVVQLIPTEVMVKRAAGVSPATKDWEFIELEVSAEGSKVNARGFVDVVNKFGGNCFACHVQANPGRDLVCEQGNGCDPIPFTPVMVKAIQNTDPRCDPVQLPPEQIEALKQLKAMLAAGS